MAIRHDVVSHPFTVGFVQIKAAQLCRRSDFSRSDDDDLRQEMLLYVWKKAHLFDPARGNIEAFVTTAIKSWVAMELRRRFRLKRCGDYKAVSLKGTMIECHGDIETLGAVLREADLHRRTQQARPSSIDLIDLQDAVRHAFTMLSPHERELLIHVAEHDVSSAARKRHVSRRQIEKAVTQMRARFEDAGLDAD